MWNSLHHGLPFGTMANHDSEELSGYCSVRWALFPVTYMTRVIRLLSRGSQVRVLPRLPNLSTTYAPKVNARLETTFGQRPLPMQSCVESLRGSAVPVVRTTPTLKRFASSSLIPGLGLPRGDPNCVFQSTRELRQMRVASPPAKGRPEERICHAVVIMFLTKTFSAQL